VFVGFEPASRRYVVGVGSRRQVAACNGTLYAVGPELLAAYVTTGQAREALLRLDDRIGVRQRGDWETTLVFPAALLDRVAKVMLPKRRPGRAATPEDLARLAREAHWLAVRGRSAA
jgi:hypothetical protein